MKLLLQLLKLKYANYFNLSRIWFVLGQILLLLTVTSCAISLSLLFETTNFEMRERLFKGLNVFLFVHPISMLFIPNYKAKVYLFKPYDPVSKFKKTALETAFNFFSPLYILVCLAIFFVMLATKNFTTIQALHLFLVIITGTTFKLSLQNALLNGQKIWFKFWIILLNIVCVTFMFLEFLNAFSILLIFVLAFFSNLLSCYISNDDFENNKLLKTGSYSLFYSLFQISNKTFTLSFNLILGLVFKCLLVYMFVLNQERDLPFKSFYGYFSISTVIFFTYSYNNLWGYLKNTYHNISSTKNIYLLFKCYLLLIFIPLLIDATITIFVIIYNHKNVVSYLEFYTLTLLIYVLVGFYSSLNSPFEVKKALNIVTFKSNTPIFYNFISIAITFIAAFAFSNGYEYYFILPTIFLISLLYYRLIFKKGIVYIVDNIFNKL